MSRLIVPVLKGMIIPENKIKGGKAMLSTLRKRCAQGTLEYALLIGVVIAALIAMNLYSRRSIMGKMRDSIKSVGEQYDANQIEAHYSTRSSTNSEDTFAAGVSSSTSNSEERTLSDSYEKVGEGGVGHP